MTMATARERRRYARREVLMALEYRVIADGVPTDTFFTLGQVVGLSLSGMRLEVPECFVPETLLEIYIVDSQTGYSFHGMVEVKRGVQEGPPYHVGVRTRMLRCLDLCARGDPLSPASEAAEEDGDPLSLKNAI